MIPTSTTEALLQVNSLASTTSHSAWGFASDFLIVLVLVGFFFIFAWYVGRGPLVAILLSYYGAYAIYTAFPYQNLLPSAPPITAFLAHALLFAAIGFIFYIILRRVVVSDFLYVGNLGLIILAFFASAFIISMLYHLIPITGLYHFTPAMDLLFAPKSLFFWWFIGPAVALFFFAR